MVPEDVALPGPVSAVSVGTRHVAAVGTDGSLFTWGAGNYGKLGLGTRDDNPDPSRVGGALEGQRVVAVDCGDHHTAAITEGGRLFTWGHGGQGRLGHGDENHAELPTEVMGVKPDHWSTVEGMPGGADAFVTSVSCGFNHTVVALRGGEVCTFGYGIYGQLGYGYRDNVEAPVLVAGPSVPLKPKK